MNISKSPIESPIDPHHQISNNDAINVPSYLPTIDEFLNDTFLYSINELKQDYKIKYIKQFTKYANSLHCLENLQFLILVFHYEFSYSKVFSTEENKLNTRRDSAITTPSVSSVDDLNNFTSTIDDEIYNGDCWDDWRDKHIEESDDEEEMQFQVDELQSEVSSLKSNGTNVSVTCLKNLNEQWLNLVNNFVTHESRYQINLSDCSYKLIMNNGSNHPEPAILLSAKKEVTRLLNENAYHKFVINCRNTSTCQDCECGRQQRSQEHPQSGQPEMGQLSKSPAARMGTSPLPRESRKSPSLNPFKLSRPTSPISIESPMLSPSPSSSTTSPTTGMKKKKAYSLISSSNNSLSNLFNHLKFKNSHNSNLSSALSTTANTDDEDSNDSCSFLNDKKYKLCKKNYV